MPVVDLSDLKKMLKIYEAAKLPLYLWGRPSTGKTSIIRQFAKDMAESLKLKYSEEEFGEDIFTLKVITLSQFDSPDLRGMPEIKNGETNFIPTGELPRCGQGILFFDELNMADDTTRAACYQLILEGSYGTLPAIKDKDGNHKFWRVAASNSENDFCNVNNLQLALLRRFSHVQVEPRPDEITDYMFSAGKVDSRVVAYLKSNPQDLFPSKWEENLITRKANPFPSTWESFGILINGVEDDKSILQIGASCMGMDLANKFKAFNLVFNKVNMDEVLKDVEAGMKKVEKMSERTAVYYSMMCAMASMWKNSDKRVTQEKLLTMIGAMPTDFKAAFITMLSKSGRAFNKFNDAKSMEKFQKVLTEIYKIYNAV